VKRDELLERAREAAAHYRVTRSRGFKLSSHDPGDSMGYGSDRKPRARELLRQGVELLADYQQMLYA